MSGSVSRLVGGLLLLVLATGGEAADYRGIDTLAVGDRLPDLPLQGLNGPSGRIAAFRGRPLIINVWASWCGPCRREMASLERLAWRDSERFSVIGVSTDDHADRARAFLSRSHATLPHYIDEHLRLEQLLGAERIPLTVLVDAQGRVLEKVYGAREWDREQAARLLNSVFEPPAEKD